MKKEKLSLKSVKNVLSRREMKKIMAGSGGYICCSCSAVSGGSPTDWFCQNQTDCFDYCRGLGMYNGTPVPNNQCASWANCS